MQKDAIGLRPPDRTCYVYSMGELQDLIYAYENDVSIKIDTQNDWFQLYQRMKAGISNEN